MRHRVTNRYVRAGQVTVRRLDDPDVVLREDPPYGRQELRAVVQAGLRSTGVRLEDLEGRWRATRWPAERLRQ